MAFNLNDLLAPPETAPELAQRQFERERTQLLAQQAHETGLGRYLLASRTLPGIRNSQAAQGSFFSGATVRKSREAGEDQAAREAQSQLNTNRALVDFLNRQFVATTGVKLG